MDDLMQLGLTTLPEVNDNLVLKMAKLCQGAGLDGVVCSAQEASSLRQACDGNFCLVTPGIRLQDNPKDDQRRVMTPEAAMAAGVSYMVIGRPITKSISPIDTLQSINKTISL
jgi:orotidine-5'-phosphate decarboxylase